MNFRAADSPRSAPDPAQQLEASFAACLSSAAPAASFLPLSHGQLQTQEPEAS